MNAIVDVLGNLFNYTQFAVAHTADGYGLGASLALSMYAQFAGLKILVTSTFMPILQDFSQQYLVLKASGARIFVIIASHTSGSRFLHGAYEAGIAGEGNLWFGTEAMTSPSLWTRNDALASDADLRERVLKGYFGVRPGYGE
eukprot:4843251-Prymnesium_polylepis.1